LDAAFEKTFLLFLRLAAEKGEKTFFQTVLRQNLAAFAAAFKISIDMELMTFNAEKAARNYA